MGDIKRGYVASDTKNVPSMDTEWFKAQVIVMNHPGKIQNGYAPVLDCHTCHIACKFKEIESKMDKRTGKVTEEFPPLGRFAVRDMKQTVAVGVVKETVKKESKGG